MVTDSLSVDFIVEFSEGTFFLYLQVLGGLGTEAPKNRQHYIFSTYCSEIKTRLGIKRVEFGFNI